ncbi:ectonucleoside triphosphate diphosphohydrolase 2 [Microcaecilia unicolor]|uniref:Ectonucleoside triphosphate diphosphohydrolase 2 n=1 Tax=Microcaecilia unicolor TaxID=1415580 RepID=A0A6P7YCV9_9AMPH|nr:ectonucleoside triphosphate diphosphohydrolase 2 [Microcaecilia unicolor]XP_030062884.1 ectonucleoside triphosphate diphosphohydrolase 2 [Microcaecilia unicolor]
MVRKVLAVVLPLLLCLAGIIGIILLSVPTKDVKAPPALKYGIVLDAGSSHTALFVYKWPADKENDTGIVSEHTMCDVNGPGISGYAHNPPEAGKSLVECLNQAQKHVPEERHSITPIYLGATAGMRLLKEENATSSNAVLESVSSTLKSYPFDFRGANILSGQEEGLFGWVTANYLLENFVKYGWIGRWIRPRKQTIGAMDLGGASTQITFETTENIENPDDQLVLRLYGQTYKVYTHSFLCYGRDQMLIRLLSKVIQAEATSTQISNPCWPRGYSNKLTLKDVFESPCTTMEKPSSYNPSQIITMTGTSSSTECREQVERLFQFGNCNFTKCSFDEVFQPSVSGNFIAFSAFYYTADFVRNTMKMPLATPEDLRNASTVICNSDWNELLEAAQGQDKFLPDYCTTSTFVYLIIINGYKFDENTFPNIAFQKKAGDTSIGWALGYMLNLTNMIPVEEPILRKGTEYGSWVVLILLFVTIILIALVLLFFLFRNGKDHSSI